MIEFRLEVVYNGVNVLLEYNTLKWCTSQLDSENKCEPKTFYLILNYSYVVCMWVWVCRCIGVCTTTNWVHIHLHPVSFFPH